MLFVYYGLIKALLNGQGNPSLGDPPPQLCRDQ